ncbi:MAG TPA: ribonuclease R [Thermoanaerobaculia bacterium]|nr:ribonuclease R [Thermoanaerobaculia bacterium]
MTNASKWDGVDFMDLPGAGKALAERVGARLEAAGARGAEAAALTERLGVDAREDEVVAALRALAADGKAVERARRWYAVRFTEWTPGRLDRVGGGETVVRQLPRGEPLFWVDRPHLKDALDGDTVLVKRLKGRSRDVAGKRLPPGSVVEVLARRSHRIVGLVEQGEDGLSWLRPYDPRSSLEVEIVESHDVPDGHFVVAEVIPSSGSRGGHPQATVAEDLGHADAPGSDLLAVLRHFRIPDQFPPEVEAAAAAFPGDPGPEDWRGREDLRDQLTVTIDGESARDFDDALTCERLGGNRWRLGVHIADVAHYVTEAGPIDREAYVRGTSVYFPERAVPMLPEVLSNGLCSLRPDVPRLALSVFLEVDGDGRIANERFAETVIRSDRRLTYTEVHRVLEAGEPGDEQEYGPVLGLLRDMLPLMQVLHRSRRERGSIDFDLPSGDVVLDTDGFTVGVKPGERNVAHRIVEEFMIAANEAVARALLAAEAPALYRVHDAPTPEDLQNLAELLRPLGLHLPEDLDRLHPRHLQRVIGEAEGTPEEHFVTTLVLRTLQRAHYSPDCRGHYALASREYTHFTSPIRRYPDLVVHRQVRRHLAGERRGRGAKGSHATEAMPLTERLPGIGEHTSTTERRAEQAERDLLQWKKVRFLADRVGDTFPGRITGVQPFGLFVQLDTFHVDGLVPIRSLGDEYFVYEEEAHQLVGDRTGTAFRLGARVEVRLVGVSLQHRGLDLEIATAGGTRHRGEGGGRRGGGRSGEARSGDGAGRSGQAGAPKGRGGGERRRTGGPRS